MFFFLVALPPPPFLVARPLKKHFFYVRLPLELSLYLEGGLNTLEVKTPSHQLQEQLCNKMYIYMYKDVISQDRYNFS